MKLLVSLLIPLAVGITAGLFTAKGVNTWYVTLNKPSFNPPNWIFGPVWTVLYLLMGVGLFLVWRSTNNIAYKKTAILIFAVQLVANFCWSFLFFSWQKPGVAFFEIALLWLLIVWMIAAFKKVNPTAAHLQIPYLCWVSFAALLNFAIWQLNG
jgi:translocator protein